MRASILLIVATLAASSAASSSGQTAAAPTRTGALVILRNSAPVLDDETRERIRERCLEYLWGLHESREFPGCSAALILPDGSSLTFPVGLRDVEAEAEMTADTLLLSGSIGKTYVTAAAHRLMLEGKLSWDQLALDFFEGEDWFLRVPNAESMTLKHLLRHESGIARHVFKP